MKWGKITHMHRARFFAKATAEDTRRPTLPWVVVALLGLMLAACAPLTGAGRSDTAGADLPQDGLVFEGHALGASGSFGKLVLEKNFEQTRKLRWQSDDAGFGAVEVDFFEPQEWELRSDSPDTLAFRDRSPGPILFGSVLFAPVNRAEVNVVLGGNRVKFLLDRVER